jgi:hypothetical protein
MTNGGATDVQLAVRFGLERAARALRRSDLAGGVAGEPDERVLRLLRNLRVLVLDGRPVLKSPIVLNIPLWIVATTRHDRQDADLDSLIADGRASLAADIVEALPRRLTKYLGRRNAARFFVDCRAAGEPTRRSTHVESAAFYPEGHPFLARERVPSLSRRAQALARLTFQRQPGGVTSLVFALNVDAISPLDRVWLAGQVTEVCQVLATELPRLLRAAPRSTRFSREPSFQTALDDLHDRIIDLARRSRLKDWGDGGDLHFFAAVRENKDRHLVLQYRLTRANLLAAASIGPNGLRGRFEKNAPALKSDLKRLAKGVRNASFIMKRCRQALTAISKDWSVTGPDALKTAIERSWFPLKLTPGFFIMRDNSPELIEDWLQDPRAMGNWLPGRTRHGYPASLLAFEAAVVPRRMYYSPLAVRDIRFGVCGIDAQLLTRIAGDHLQEVIDNAAPIILERLREEKRREIAADLLNAGDKAGLELVHHLLDHLRTLALFAIPTGEDAFSDTFQTTVLRTGTTPTLDQYWQPKEGWLVSTSLGGLSNHALDGLARAAGRHEERPNPRLRELDSNFLEQYFTTLARKARDNGEADTMSALRKHFEAGTLFRLQFAGAPGFDVVVLVPQPRHVIAAEAFLRDFAALSNEAYGVPATVAQPTVLGHTFRRVLPFIKVGGGQSAKGSAPLLLLTDILDVTLDFFQGRLNPASGEGLDAKEVVALLAEIAAAIEWCARQDPRNKATEVSLTRARMFRDAIRRVQRTAPPSAFRLPTLDQRRGLLFFWELALNICLHAQTRMALEFRRGGRDLVFTNDLGRGEIPDRTGRYGLKSLQHLAAWLHVDYRPIRSSDVYVSTIRSGGLD